MAIKRRIIKHFFHVQSALDKVNSDAYLNTKTFFLELQLSDKSITLYPQFTYKTETGTQYSDQCDYNRFACFNGWRPYRPRSVAKFTDKLLFKQLIVDQGVNAPDYTCEYKKGFPAAIVKNKVSSFSDSIKGPYKDTSCYEINKDLGQYFEQFIIGDIVKIWYLKDQPIVFEKFPMPFVIGDGRSTLEELIKKKMGEVAPKKLVDISESMLRFSGYQLSDVLAVGEKQIVDFKYVTSLRDIEDIEVADIQDSELLKQLETIGKVVWSIAQQDTQGMLIYTVDAILDSSQTLWVLEANSNPIVHPCCYGALVSSLQP
jgi:hypothetical protein